MSALESVPISPLAPDRFRAVLSESQAEGFDQVIAAAPTAFAGRVVWNVNSTANGGGVAEMLHSLIAYGRGARVDARWVVISGNPAFFEITKRIHNRLHESAGDGGQLGPDEQAAYQAVTDATAAELVELVRPGDIVLLHDPQTAGLAAPLVEAGAHVVWRCHVGIDTPGDLARSAWEFLLPHVIPAAAYIFSRDSFVWDGLDRERVVIIPPSIDAFSAKNQELDAPAVNAILVAAGLSSETSTVPARFERRDGTPGRVDRRAQVWEDEPLPPTAQLVLQVSRWDRLKDPIGVMDGFARHIAGTGEAHLMLAGPEVAAVADDPEGLQVLEECIAYREALAPEVRRFVHLAALPMTDQAENAAIVNALQRRASVVVQKSIAEGFGLTVAEAMWKERPVVASCVGGIQDQIVDGVSGFLVDPRDLAAFGNAVRRLLGDPPAAERMGAEARERVRAEFLGSRSLSRYLELFSGVIGKAERELTVA